MHATFSKELLEEAIDLCEKSASSCKDASKKFELLKIANRLEEAAKKLTVEADREQIKRHYAR